MIDEEDEEIEEIPEEPTLEEQLHIETPAQQIHFDHIVFDLRPVYDWEGIKRWFNRERAALYGWRPKDFFVEGWKPEDPFIQKIAQLAASLKVHHPPVDP